MRAIAPRWAVYRYWTPHVPNRARRALKRLQKRAGRRDLKHRLWKDGE